MAKGDQKIDDLIIKNTRKNKKAVDTFSESFDKTKMDNSGAKTLRVCIRDIDDSILKLQRIKGEMEFYHRTRFEQSIAARNKKS